MKLTCWGAARQVTGSMHHIQLDTGYQILVDCGLDYEKRYDSDPNIRFPFNPSDIDAVLLTHAHIDHSGNIPNLVKQGFKGEIICTEPTAYLLDKLWTDSVGIMSKESRKRRQVVKLYGYKDVQDALSQILTLPFNKVFALQEHCNVKFVEAGHILGAASIQVDIHENGKTKKLGFTGDLGNYNSKLIVDPVPLSEVEYLVMESTYGNREHRGKNTPEQELLKHVTDACVKQNGKLIIPAFSVGRTQAILFTLNKLMKNGDIPEIKVFADSPLGMASSRIHEKFREYLNDEARMALEDGESLFDFKSLTLIQGEEDAEEMSMHIGSSIVVSSAGMLEGGKIQQHISENIENPGCTILIAGFCAPGTLGAQLLEGRSSLRIGGRDRYVYARILQTDVFSAHPDKHGLLRYLRESKTDHLKELFLVHGEEQIIEDFSHEIAQEFKVKTHIPVKGQVFDI